MAAALDGTQVLLSGAVHLVGEFCLTACIASQILNTMSVQRIDSLLLTPPSAPTHPPEGGISLLQAGSCSAQHGWSSRPCQNTLLCSAAVSQVSSRLITFVLNLLIARLLTPEAYGVRRTLLLSTLDPNTPCTDLLMPDSLYTLNGASCALRRFTDVAHVL